MLVGSRTLRLAWDDVATIRVCVDEREGRGRPYPMPRRLRNHVFVHLAWRTTDGVDHRQLLVAPPFVAGTDLPLVHDLDVALTHFAGSRRRAPVGA